MLSRQVPKLDMRVLIIRKDVRGVSCHTTENKHCFRYYWRQKYNAWRQKQGQKSTSRFCYDLGFFSKANNFTYNLTRFFFNVYYVMFNILFWILFIYHRSRLMQDSWAYFAKVTFDADTMILCWLMNFTAVTGPWKNKK